MIAVLVVLFKECGQIAHLAAGLGEEGSVNDATFPTGGCVLILSRNFVQYACFGLFGIIALQVRKPVIFYTDDRKGVCVCSEKFLCSSTRLLHTAFYGTLNF